MKSYHPKPHKDRLDYNRITNQIYIGTNQCCQTHFAEELLSKGVLADLSLEEKRLDAPFGVKYYLWLPTRDHSPPTPKQLEVGVSFLDLMIKFGEKIYVHCKKGHGRAPTLVAAYFITQGMTPGEAFRFIKKRRKVIHLRLGQKKALQLFYKNYKRNKEHSRQNLAKLLKEAKQAHGKYEKSIGRRDETWPDWYARYIGRQLKQ